MSEPGVSVADQEQMLCTNCFFREAACVDSDRHLKNCMTLTMTIPQSSCTDFEEYETLKVHHQWVKAKIDGKTCLTSWVNVLYGTVISVRTAACRSFRFFHGSVWTE